MEDGIGCLKLLRSLNTVAITHLRFVLDGAAFGRAILLSILKKLQHNKII